jgi:hypothetical protein
VEKDHLTIKGREAEECGIGGDLAELKKLQTDGQA